MVVIQFDIVVVFVMGVEYIFMQGYNSKIVIFSKVINYDI